MKNRVGGKFLHQVKNKVTRERVWGKRESELRRLAEKWEDDGVPFDEVVERIADLARAGKLPRKGGRP